MDWMRRVRSVGLAAALLLGLGLGATPALAGSVRSGGMVTGKSSTPQTLVVDDHVTLEITPDTQIVDAAGNRVSFASIPVPQSGMPGNRALVDYEGQQSGSAVVVDRVVVRIVTE